MKAEAAEEYIARLNAQTQSLEMRVQGLQGGLTAHDIAQAMRGADVIEDAIARFKFANQLVYRETIIQWLWAIIIGYANRGKWRTTPDQHRAMAEIVLNDNHPEKPCPVCKGRKIAPNSMGKLVLCLECNGNGFTGLMDKERAALLGIKKAAYSRFYQRKISVINQEFRKKYEPVIYRITRYLSEHEEST